MILEQWAIKHGVPVAAIVELRHALGVGLIDVTAPVTLRSESDVQAAVRLEAARKGIRLWRNNVGAIRDERGVPVRFGLANDSARLNAEIKSSDLIGWRIGTGQIVCREIKAPGWRYAGTPREKAQLRWLDLVNADGGDAAFTTGEGSL